SQGEVSGTHDESGLLPTEPPWHLRPSRQRLGMDGFRLGLGPGAPGRRLEQPRRLLPGGVPLRVRADGPGRLPRLPTCPSSRPAQVGQARANACGARSGGQRAESERAERAETEAAAPVAEGGAGVSGAAGWTVAP